MRHHIDIALQQDEAHRRRRNMRFLVLPTRFPRPENMAQGDISVWTNWIREETDEIMKQLEEERHSRSDPDDPFSGTANGVFQPLQDPLSLPPPVQTPKRQGNNSEDLEHSQNSRKNVRKHNTASREERRNERVTSAQGELREFREHSRESLDPMTSIRNLHIQQRKSRQATGLYRAQVKKLFSCLYKCRIIVLVQRISRTFAEIAAKYYLLCIVLL